MLLVFSQRRYPECINHGVNTLTFHYDIKLNTGFCHLQTNSTFNYIGCHGNEVLNPCIIAILGNKFFLPKLGDLMHSCLRFR